MLSPSKIAFTGFIVYLYFSILNISALLPVLLNLGTGISRIITYAPLGLLTGVVFLIPKSKGHKKTKINLWIIAFLAYLIIGTFSGLIFTENLKYLRQALTYFSRITLELGLFYFFILSLDKVQIKKVIINITIAYIIIALSIPIMAVLGISLYESITGLESVIESGRPAGLAANANPAAFQSILGLILILFWLFNNPKPIIRNILCVLLVTQIGCTIFTFSNTGMISLVAVVVFAIWKTSFLKSGVYKFSLFLVFLSIVAAQSVNFSIADQLNPHNLKKLENFYKIITLDDNVELSQRDSKIKIGISELKKSPLIGSGLGSFKHKLSVHNTYLTIIGESGFIPLIFFLFVLGLIFKTGVLSNVPGLSFLFMSSVTVYALFCITLQNMTDQLQYHIFFMVLLKNKNYFKSPLSK